MGTDKNSPKGKKLLLFRVLAVLFPFVLLCLLEVGLRIFNYGHNTALFVKYPKDDRFMQMNYYASDKFFSDTINATKGNSELFAVNKAPNTFRIFVLGESTTIGYPYFHNGSFHRWLQYRLERMYPDKNFEIINLSLTAVNSYTVLDFGKQLAQYQPDAILIYTGHNEYYGALGIGSTSYISSNRFLVETLLKLRELKLTQLLNNVMKKVANMFSDKKIDDRETLMKRMAARQEIAFGSKDYQAGIEQFDKNMTELCGLFNKEKIPVFLSTVVSNEKDLPPFISVGRGSGSAAYNYKAGQQAYAHGDFTLAKQYFDKARDLDELRFRAPDEINEVIKRLANEYPYVHLVDTKKLFEDYSPHGIIDSETILEHVHPNLHGYAIMSEAFYQSMQQQHLIADTPQMLMTFDELQKEMPLTRMDSLSGQYQVIMLKTGWPFNQPIPKQFSFSNNIEEILADKVGLGHMEWIVAMGQVYEHNKLTGNVRGELKVIEAMTLELPQNEQFCSYAANLNGALNNFDKAAFYYKKLYMLSPNDQVAQSIIQSYLRADEPQYALANVGYLPQDQQDRLRSLLSHIIVDKEMLKADAHDTLAMTRLAENYAELGIVKTSSEAK
ncbi:GDSL-type esterase/lipase family protein [Mucilaginibacter sp. X5P1]|uniref:GDSL-type esterase/lipase family protein n=1 Tax=Mucilaginibacter sp. X5P1 TaxID=2723088 RepID=UPI001618A9DC|nr:hypothetical protein [Mucilaginibacter sp. X5P1]MBB6141487.1 lysophospholipase L1-like esterase [Mucilaginibacter sp. X5P1]